jgi:hypothetical protein
MDKNVKILTLRKQCKSYREISDILQVPKSTIAYVLRGNVSSVLIKQKLIKRAQRLALPRMKQMSQIAKANRTALYLKTRQEAGATFKTNIRDPLFVAGLAIYWGEGDSKLENGIVRVANTDPVMLKMFVNFITKFLPIDRKDVRAYLITYPDLIDSQCLQYWARHIQLSVTSFYGSHVIKGRHPTRRLSHGICTVMIAKRVIKEIVLEWLRHYKKKFA